MHLDASVIVVGILSVIVCGVVSRGHPIAIVSAFTMTALYWVGTLYE